MKKILVVDDSLEARILLKLILEDHGYDPYLAVSGESAFMMMSEMKIDLVISDLEMPQGGGIWLLEKINELESPPKIIILSGNISIDEEDLLNKGALAFFRKPISFSRLLNFITSVI